MGSRQFVEFDNQSGTYTGNGAPFTITLAGLPTSSVGAGRQSSMEENVTLYGGKSVDKLFCFGCITVGNAPTGNTAISIYRLRGSGGNTTFRTDNAGATDGNLTRVTADLLKTIKVDTTSYKTYYFDFTLYDPGPEFGLNVVQNTGKDLAPDAGNHAVWHVMENRYTT